MKNSHTYILYVLLAVGALMPFNAFGKKGVNKSIYTEKEKRDKVDFMIGFLSERYGQLDTIRNEMRITLQKGAYNDVIDMSRMIYDEACRKNDEKLIMTSALFIGQSYGMMAMGDSMNLYLDESLNYAKKYNDTFTLSRIYNSLGIYAVINEMDLSRGLRFYHQALEVASQLDDDFHLAIKSNLAYAYYYRKDSAGLKYAQEVYNESKKSNDLYRLYNGAFVSAYMYYLLEDYEEALRYIEETLSVVDNYYGQTHVYTLHGDILHALGDNEGAQRSYLKAFEYYDETEASIVLDAFVSYGKFLMDIGKTETAIYVLELGIDFALENNISITRYKLYETVSEGYKILGDNRRALDYYTLFHIEADSIFNVERERSLNELRISYDTERQARELQRKELQLVKGRQKQNLLIFALSVILIILIAFYSYYRRKNKLYFYIIQNYRELKRANPQIFADFQLMSNAVGDGDTEDQDDEAEVLLFKELESKMKRDRLYRDNDLTADKLAAIMNINRPMLSKVINQHSGKNYNRYINSYRIQEAVEVLSDDNNDIPLKALAQDLGFNSLSVFYAAFKELIGVSPSKFRENWRKIDKDEASLRR